MISPETQELAAQIARYMEMNTPRIEKCLAELTEEELWQRPNPQSNSVGNLLLHLCGNITQYILCSLGGQPDHRVRDAEFAAEGGFTKTALLEKLRATVSQATQIVRSASREEMLRERTVQGFQMSGIGIAVHVCEHYSYHTGQIAFWVKILRSKDLGFYAGQNLNAMNGQ
ncbi:MAG: DinB family protein [Saprospiraceae bacterium]